MSKYHNEKITVNGETFDSKNEFHRWCELKLLQRAGKITGLERQVQFTLIPAQYVDGKLVEKACTYVADFVYYEQHDPCIKVVEDVKGVRTETYRIKRKLMLQVWGIRIRET